MIALRAASLALMASAATSALAAEKTAACPDVIKTLERLDQVIPTLRGDDDALSRSFLLMVATQAEKTQGKEQYVAWSSATVTALVNLGQSARAFMTGGLAPGDATLNHFLALAQVAAAEARSICVQPIPPLAGAD